MNLSEDKITRAQRCYQPEEKGWHEEEPKQTAEDKSDDDSDDSNTNDGWGLLRRACSLYHSDHFQDELDAFAREHAATFKDAIGEEEKAEEHTHKLRYSEIHRRYLSLLEDLLSDFLKKEERSAEDLFSDMKDAKQNNYTALFEEHEYHGFVQSVLAGMEYEHFFRLMLKAARRELGKKDENSGRGGADPTDCGTSETRSCERVGGGRYSLGSGSDSDSVERDGSIGGRSPASTRHRSIKENNEKLCRHAVRK